MVCEKVQKKCYKVQKKNNVVQKVPKKVQKVQTSKNVVKYDPLKRIFLGRYSYVETELSTKLRSY